MATGSTKTADDVQQELSQLTEQMWVLSVIVNRVLHKLTVKKSQEWSRKQGPEHWIRAPVKAQSWIGEGSAPPWEGWNWFAKQLARPEEACRRSFSHERRNKLAFVSVKGKFIISCSRLFVLLTACFRTLMGCLQKLSHPCKLIRIALGRSSPLSTPKFFKHNRIRKT